MRKPITLFLLILLVLVLPCLSQDNPSIVSQANINTIAKVQAGDFAPGQLQAHYRKHGSEFGNISQDRYLANARALLNAAPSEDILEKIRPNGDILHYKISTAEFAVMTKAGRIRTYFKADYKYWLKQ
jgi:pyocin large subunit-like protein